MKRVLLTAVALLFGAAAFAQPSASVETLARKYADRDGALVMRLDSTMVGLVKLRVAALPDSLRRSAALLDKVSGMTNIMLMTGLARTLDPAADTTAFVRLESDFRADVAALTAEPVRRRLFREREAGVEVAGYYSAAPSGEAELVLVVSGGGNEALCVLGGRFGEEEALRLAVDFTLLCIQVTCRDENAPWYGVEFEKALRYLPELLER